MSVIPIAMFVFVCYRKANHLNLSLKTVVDKKSNAVCIFTNLCFTLFKLNIIFSLVLFSVKIHKRRGKRLTSEKLNVNRQFFKYVICIFFFFFFFWFYSVLPNCRGETVPILRKNCHLFHLFPFVKTFPNQIKIFVYSTYPFLLQTPSLPAYAPFNQSHLLKK